MELLFDGIPLGEVSTSMTINAPASLLLLLYELVAEEQGVPAEALRGTVQNDILKEYCARGNYIFPPRPSMRITTDLFAYCHERLPRWNTISISGYHIREAGSTAVQELAFTLANGIAYCAGGGRRRACRRTSSARGSRSSSTRTTTSSRRWRSSARRGGCGRGSCASASARRTRRRSRCASTRRPAARRSPRSSRRTTSCAWRSRRSPPSAGGAQSIHTNGFDEALALPTERSAQIALRTQQILADEAGGTDTADPLGGAYFIEALTDELEERAWELIEQVDELGGAVAAIEHGFVQHEIEEAAFRYTQQVESGERVIVGVNRFAEEEAEPIELHRLDPEAERRQLERTARVRAERNARGGRRRARGRCAASRGGDENLLPPMREALRARCTIGEICNTLRDEFGTYDAHRPWPSGPAADHPPPASLAREDARVGDGTVPKASKILPREDPARLADVSGAGATPTSASSSRGWPTRSTSGGTRSSAPCSRAAPAAGGATSACTRRRPGPHGASARTSSTRTSSSRPGLLAALATRAPLVVTAHGRDVRNVGSIPGVARRDARSSSAGPPP